jgi:hypothetical protein
VSTWGKNPGTLPVPGQSTHQENTPTIEAVPNLFEQELATFAAHKADLLRDHPGKWVLIKGDQVLGVYEDQMAAANAGYQKLGNVAFLTKEILEQDRVYEFSPRWAPLHSQVTPATA